MDFEQWEYRNHEFPKNPAEKAPAEEALKQQFLDEVKANPKAMELLQEYYPHDNETFLNSFAIWKTHLVKHPKLYIGNYEKQHDPPHLELAEKAIDAILMKKLCNVQYLWCAEQLELPQVWSTKHFIYWSQRVRECPFLEPITQQELDLMKQYLKDRPERNWEECSSRILFMTMEMATERYKERVQPDWFVYYDTYMGTGWMGELPNIRLEKENHYIHIRTGTMPPELKDIVTDIQNFFLGEGMPQQREDWEPDEDDGSEEPRHKILSHGMHHRFAKEFDDKYFQALFLHRYKLYYTEKQNYLQEATDSVVHRLSKFKIKPRIRNSGNTWLKTLEETASIYENNAVAELIDTVHQQYLFYLETGMVHTPNLEEIKKAYENEGFCRTHEEMIMEGRRHFGEPEDWNF